MSFANQFGWSISRESMFDSCRRRYYYHYYLSWGGWNDSAPPLAREAFKLKRLTSLPLWRGQLIHYVTTKVLSSLRRRGHLPPLKEVQHYISERFEKQFDFSEKKKYLTEPKKRGNRLNIDWLALFEHEYDRPLGWEKIKETLDDCLQSMEGLLECPLLREISQTDSSHWVIENIDLAEFAQVFDFEGARVFAKTDFMFRGRDETFNIVDWKSFRKKPDEREENPEEGKARVQLGVYGYYAAKILQEPLPTIRLQEVNLLDNGKVVVYSINDEDLALFYEYIKKGVAKLASVLIDGDIKSNQALPREHFPKTENNLCRYCNFYRICIEKPQGE